MTDADALDRSTEARRKPLQWAGVAALAVVYYVLLLKDYEYSISPRFRYMMFLFRGVDLAELLTDLVFVVVPTLFLPLRGRKVSDAAVIFVYLIAYVPTVMMITAVKGLGPFDMTALKVSLLLSLGMLALVPRLAPRFTLPSFRFGPQTFLLIVLGASVAAFVFIGSKYGFRLSFHSLTNVYEQRDAYKSELGGVRFANYFSGLLRGATGPILIAAGLATRRYWMAAVGLFFFMYLYSVMASKSALLGPAYVVVCYYVVKLFERQFFAVCLLGCVGIVGGSWLTADTPGLSIFNDLFVRRVLILQGLLFEYYVEAFDSIEPLLMRHSILGFLGEPPIADPEGYVGATKFVSTAHANANIFSDGYINLKHVGVLLSGFFAGAFVTLLDKLTERMPRAFAIAACGTMLQMLTQTGLIKTFGSHGGVVLCGLLLAMPVEFLWTTREKRLRLAGLWDDEPSGDDEVDALATDAAAEHEADVERSEPASTQAEESSTLRLLQASVLGDFDDHRSSTSIDEEESTVDLLAASEPRDRLTELQESLAAPAESEWTDPSATLATRHTNDRLAQLQRELAGDPVDLPGTVAVDGVDSLWRPRDPNSATLPPGTPLLRESPPRTASDIEIKTL